MAVDVYSVLNRAGISIVRFTSQGCLLCGSRDTWYLTCASHGSGCLYVPQLAEGVYSVLNRAGVSIVCLTGQGCLFCAS